MEIFSWIKRHPAGDRPLGGLLVMDEAQTLAPSAGITASTHSTIMLASQARKYGLGLLFATQAPKGLHNQITGNATTQFFGRLNSPAQIAAANEMARAKGSTVGDISQLERGQFYVTGETFGFRRLQAPLCLSHHPPSPLRLEEVIERARNGTT
jgi:DNA helicase HerA-like ATPase